MQDIWVRADALVSGWRIEPDAGNTGCLDGSTRLTQNIQFHLRIRILQESDEKKSAIMSWVQQKTYRIL